MKQVLTRKVKIVPNDLDKQALIDTMHAYRDACNFVSEYIYQTHDLKQVSVHNQMYSKLREKFGLRSQMAQSVILTVIAKYKTIKSNGHEFTKPVFNKPQLDLVWNRDYSFVKDKTLFSVNTLYGRIKASYLVGPIELTGKFGTAKLVYKHGKFFLHIPCETEVDDLSVNDVSNVVGIDRGIRFLAVTYDSNGKSEFYSGSEVKQKRAHYKALRTQLQQVKTPSSRRRLKAIGSRENRWMNDVNHCLSKALVENNPDGTLFVFEDLADVRTATERVRKRHRYVSVSWSYYDLEQKLKYKVLRNHQMVVNVDPRYTSQTCPKCGHVSKSNRNKKNHIFVCENCGYSSNDDRIGAMNLHRMGIEYLVQSCENNVLTSG